MSLKRLINLRHTLTFRLTLWYTIIFTIASSFLFLVLFHQIGGFIDELSKNELLSDLNEYTLILESKGIDALREDVILESEAEGSDRIFFRILSAGGEEIVSSENSAWKGIGIDLRAIEEIKAGKDHLFVKVDLEGKTHKALVMYAPIGSGIILQACHSLDESEEHLLFFANVFAVLMVSIILLASFFGWLMLRRAFSGVSEVTNTAMEIEKGEFGRRVSVMNKGSEINDLTTAFNRMLDRIDSLIKGMREMSDNIAHDLRSPITRIRGMAEMVLTSKSNLDDYREVSSTTLEECDRLLSMINTMLDISETEAGAAMFNMSMVNMSEVLEEAIELFQPMAEEKKIAIIPSIQENCYLKGDIHKLQRMVANIVDNAIKYAGMGGKVSVTITADDHIEINISDSGTGISPEDLPHIFERFYRGDKSRSKSGIGLGLSLARAIARAHGGDIMAVSPRENGCTFIIILPLDAKPEEVA